MAQRRMFSLKVIDTDDFLNMPSTTRLLYFDMSMRADDDGFVASPQKIIKMTGAAINDFEVLCAKKYLIPFGSGVCVIRHWRVHNYIQNDRYDETLYKQEKSILQVIDNKYETIEDTSCIQNVSKMDTQVRLGKDRLGEENILLSVDSEQQKVVKIPYEEIKILYTEILVNPFPVCRFLSDKRKKLIKARWREQLPDLNSWKEYFSRIAESDFLMGRTTGKTGKPFLCSLDWILNQSNCIKILECTYSNGRWD